MVTGMENADTNIDALEMSTADAVEALDFESAHQLKKFARSNGVAPRGPDRWPTALLTHARIRELASPPRATAAQAAKHVFMSEARFFQLIRAGAISRQEGGYDLARVRLEYFNHLRDGASRR
jgi:hypothetical protein